MVLLASDFDKSKYFKAADLEHEKKFRIKSVTKETIGAGADKEDKLVAWFTNDERELVLNKTNNRTLRGAYGDTVGSWNGKIIIVFPTSVDMRGKMTTGLRVRIPPPKQQPAMISIQAGTLRQRSRHSTDQAATRQLRNDRESSSLIGPGT